MAVVARATLTAQAFIDDLPKQITSIKSALASGDPVATAVFNAMSLTFPDGEKMFIDAVKHFRPQVQEAGNAKLLAEHQVKDTALWVSLLKAANFERQ